MSSPEYEPEFLNDDSRLNVACLFDVHAGQKDGKDYAIGHNLGEYMNEISEGYSIDETVIGGDFGTKDALTGFLAAIDEDLKVRVIEGDGDREKKKVEGEEMAGWRYHTHPEAEEPFPNTEANYELEGRSFKYEFDNYEAWLQHENKDTGAKDDILFNVEADLRGIDYNPEDLPEEFLDEPVIGVHGHLHHPQPSEFGDGALFSMGGFRNNYDTTKLIPDRSYHILSFDDEQVDNLHLDADTDEVFEHHSFILDDGSFRKEFEYGEENADLSPLQRFRDVPERVRQTEHFEPNPAD